MRYKNLFLWVVLLVAIEQFIKLIIRAYYMEVGFEIIPPLFYFLPKVNTNYSYINDLLGLGISKTTHIVTAIIGFLIILFLHDFFRTILTTTNKLRNTAFAFGLSGILCVLIDNAFLGGSLDYIYLKPLFIFDLKDIYLNCFVFLMLYNLLFIEKLTDDKQVSLKNYYKKRFTD